MKDQLVSWVKQNWILSIIIGAFLALGLGYALGVLSFYIQHA